MQFMPFLIVLFADVLTSPPPKSFLIVTYCLYVAQTHVLLNIN